jgi:hypothetical protein
MSLSDTVCKSDDKTFLCGNWHCICRCEGTKCENNDCGCTYVLKRKLVQEMDLDALRELQRRKHRFVWHWAKYLDLKDKIQTFVVLYETFMSNKNLLSAWEIPLERITPTQEEKKAWQKEQDEMIEMFCKEAKEFNEN